MADDRKKPATIGVVVNDRPASAPAISSIRLPDGTIAKVISRTAFDKGMRRANEGKPSK
jgi:hypothetical protein